MHGLIPAFFGEGHIVEYGLQIKSGSADQNRDFAARLNVRYRIRCALLKLHRVKILFGLQNVDQMVRNSLHLFCSNFSRPDVHAAVYLHGIRGDDFTVQFFGKCKGERGFSDRRGAGERNQRLFLTQCA